MLFKHYILTRFNLIYEPTQKNEVDYVNSNEYLSARFALFENYCFPSVRKQINNNFTWLVLFNDKLPEKWKCKLEQYKQQLPNFEARFISAEEIKSLSWHATLTRLVVEELNDSHSNAEFILTTRLDNDDAIHLSFVDSVQKYFLDYRQEAIINYIDGLQYISQHNILKNINFPNSHFCTLIEKNTKNVKTALGFSHSELPNSFEKVVLKTKKRMWIEVIHSTNVINTASFQPCNLFNDLFFIGFKYRNLEEFGIKQNIVRFNFGIWKVFFEWFFRKCKEKIVGK